MGESKHIRNLAVGGICLILGSILLGVIISLYGSPIHFLDLSVYQALYPPASETLVAMWRGISTLGNTTSTIILTLVALVFLIRQRRTKEVLLWIVVIFTMMLLTTTLKNSLLIERPLISLVESTSNAYPSGHATKAATLGMLALLVFIPNLKSRRRKIVFTCVCIALTLLIGVSRLALGAHWLSDVVGGLLLGSGIPLALMGIVYLVAKNTAVDQHPNG